MAQHPARGDIVRTLRTLRGIRAMDLADAVGISKSAMSHIEAGRPGRGAARYATPLADRLGVDVEVLTGQKPVIAALRDAQHIPAAVLARDLGITPYRLRRLESGADLPDDRLCAVLARRLGVPATVIRPPLWEAA